MTWIPIAGAVLALVTLVAGGLARYRWRGPGLSVALDEREIEEHGRPLAQVDLVRRDDGDGEL